jgi:dynein heavy chain
MPELELIIERLGECRILNPIDNEEDRIEIKPGVATEYIEDGIVKDFRLILTSMPCDYFPITTLQNGVKLTNEPPKGIKANMLKALNDLPEDFLDFDSLKEHEPPKKENLKNLLFSLCLFHAVILERRKFGPLGYNILYDFNDSDLDTTLKTLKIMIGKYTDVPFSALKYLTAEINYGGRVTDPWDRRVVNTILDIFFNDESLVPDTKYTSSPIYVVPEVATVPEMIQVTFSNKACQELSRG